MTTLLTSDWHLSDTPLDEYRWRIFDVLRDTIRQFNIKHVYILGDLTDRKDRHTGTLSNRLITALNAMLVRPTILMGNHDQPLNGTPFWTLLNATSAARFITEPWRGDRILWLPFSRDPTTDWRDLDFSGTQAVFMHQTITGAMGNNGYKIDGDRLPILSRRLNIWSGDVHTPQRISNVEYVGAPYPVKFGDTYKCRFVLLDDDLRFKQEIILNPIRKAVLTINSIRDLVHADLRRDDQVRIHYNLPLDDVPKWPAIKDQIREWAIDHSILLVSIDTVVEVGSGKRRRRPIEDTHDPLAVYRAFVASEQLSGDLIRSGLKFLEDTGHAEV